ncbi:MAG: hypothetical protein VZR56_04935 [Treponema sp.]|nr:hypothetical protein [Treponema sp.]
MHRKNFLSTILVSLILILPCHASGISKWWAEITSPKLSIDFSLRISEGHPVASEENYFRWKDSSGDSAKDSLDAITGASKSASTKRFDSIMYANPGDKNNLFPQSLRNLFLYAVTSQDFMDKDDFLIESDQGKITIQFRHRGSAYKIVTDEKGLLNFTQAAEEKKAPENQDAPTSDSPKETDGTPNDDTSKDATSKDATSNDVTPNSAATENESSADAAKSENAANEIPAPKDENPSAEGHFFVAKSVAEQGESLDFNLLDAYKSPEKDGKINWLSLPYEKEIFGTTLGESTNKSTSFYYKGKFSVSYDGTTLRIKGKVRKLKTES